MCRTAFSPEYGLFSANSDNRMYPFPGAFAMHPDAEKLFRFLGKVGLVTAFLGTETHSETPQKRVYCETSIMNIMKCRWLVKPFTR